MSHKIPPPEAFPDPVDGRPDLLIVAGEHSGDEHAALIVRDLKARYPDLRVACLGGVELEREGAQLLYDLTQVSIVGFVEVLRHLSFFRALFERTLEWIQRAQPRHVCFVDYPGFNLRMAKMLCDEGLSRKGGGEIGVSYYVSPQIWAWKAKRRFKMEKILDRIGVIFPFEVDCYADTSLPAEFVGHPFVRGDHQLPFAYEADGPILLLPGSRHAAVGRIFPILLEGFRLALKKNPTLRARVVYPSEAILELEQSILNRFGDLRPLVEFIPNGSDHNGAGAVLMSSGTMSLNVALSGIPGAIAYRLNPLSYLLGRLLVRGIRYIGIANILLDRHVHREYLQGTAKPAILAEEILSAYGDPQRAKETAQAAEDLRAHLSSEDLSAADWLARGMGL